VLDPGRKATKSGYFWAVVADDRGHGGTGPPIVLFHYAPGRGKEHPLKFLAGYRGRFLQCDAYQSYNALTEIARDKRPVAAGLLLDPCPPPLRQALRERGLTHRRGDAAPDRGCSIRSRRPCAARPLPTAWPPGASTPPRSSPRSSPGWRPSSRASRRNPSWPRTSATPSAHWPGLIRFLDDGTLELDTNPVENQIRPIALTRKNALFAGNEIGAENWAMLASLVATCKMSGVNPVDYLAATLRAILDGHPKSRIEDLMPWRFESSRQASPHRASPSRLP
jgi:transposase